MITHDNVLMKDYTSLRAGGLATKLIELEQNDSLQQVLKAEPKPLLVLGYGTNCLISDQGLDQTVIINKSGQIEKISPTRYKVDSGVVWDKFIERTVEDGLWGLEFTSGIPGGTGAALAGNIAAYGHAVSDRIIEAEVLDLDDGAVSIWPKSKMGLSYRTSAFQKAENSNKVILNITVELSSKPLGEMEYESALKVAKELGVEPDSLANRRQIILEARRRTGSILADIKAGPWTAGSFFRNPLVTEDQFQSVLKFEENAVTRDLLVKQSDLHHQGELRAPAALVMLAAGFKRGQTWGQVRLHPDHILKIENVGQATAKEIYDVVQEVITTVKTKLEITLEPEVKILGKF